MQQNMPIYKALFIVVIVALLALGFLWILSKFITSEISLGLLGFAGAIITASIQFRAAKEKEADARLFSEKQKVYTELITLLTDLFVGHKFGKQKPDDMKLASKLSSIRTKLLIWGSYESIRLLDSLGELSLSTEFKSSPIEAVIWQGKLMHSIRKDLGHNDPNGSGIEIALGTIIAEDRLKLREALKKSK